MRKSLKFFLSSYAPERLFWAGGSVTHIVPHIVLSCLGILYDILTRMLVDYAPQSWHVFLFCQPEIMT